jgi:hypothetical protein
MFIVGMTLQLESADLVFLTGATGDRSGVSRDRFDVKDQPEERTSPGAGLRVRVSRTCGNIGA